MWTINSTDVQQAKERIDRRRAELETRYANERKALDAEGATIETLEHAAAEFARQHNHTDPAPATAPTEAAIAEPADQGEAAESALGDDTPPPAADMAPPPPSDGESAPAASGEANLSFDILKPGSRWRLNRATRLLNPESGSEPASSAD